MAPYNAVTTIFINPIFSGCSSDSGGNSRDTSIGKVNALGISGLSYRTASQSGKTNAYGQFQYYPGETRLNALKMITVGIRFYLDNYITKHSDADTSIKQVQIRRIGGSAELAEVEYFVAGLVGGESEIVISFTPENTYRWVRKTLRVVIID